MSVSKFSSYNSFLPAKISLKKKEILSTEKTLKKLENLYLSYDYIKLFIASPQKIRNWAQKLTPRGEIIGEVLLPETINFKTRYPELFGLFCERIFGTTQDLRCRCGTYRGALLNKVCETCEIEVTEARVRRYRLGYIQFICPIAHYWYFKGIPNYLLLLLRFFSPTLTSKTIDSLIYYQEGIRFLGKIANDEISYLVKEKYRKFCDENKELLKKLNKKKPNKTKEPPFLLSFILKGILMKGGFEQYYRDYNLNSKSEARYAQEYCLKILLYVHKDRDEDFDILQEKHEDYEDFKKLNQKYIELYGEKYSTQFQLLNFRNLSLSSTIKDKDIKKMIDIIKKNSSKYLFKKPFNPFSFIPTEILKEFSFQEIEIIRNDNFHLFEEFPSLTPKMEEFFSIKRNRKYNPFNRIKFCRKGAEIFQHMLQRMDPESIMIILRNKITKNFNFSTPKIKFYAKQFRIFNSFFETKTNPGWIILTNIPVLPPTLRPFVEIDSGQLISADINEIYRLLVIRNNRLAIGIFRHEHPEQILFYNRQIIQQTVDSLIDNARVSEKKVIEVNERPLKGLTEILEGKFGRFRFTLLGKRVDYSGRSVISVNPQLKLNQCGLPYLIAIEIYQPFLIKEIITRFLNSSLPIINNIKKAELILIKNFPITWRLLEELMNDSTVLLNRAPTLHKFGIQAFNPFPILGQAIQIHPLVCTGFNADFDGDQMAVHLPLYKTTQLEIKSIMRPISNIFSPSNGNIAIKPSQDIVIGCYYLTMMINKKGVSFKHFFANEEEALFSFYRKRITLHTPILIRYSFSNFLLYYNKNLLTISSIIPNSTILPKYISSHKIKIFKIFKKQAEESKLYFYTNIGILVTRKKTTNIYEIMEIFFETNPGRILFSNTLKAVFS